MLWVGGVQARWRHDDGDGICRIFSDVMHWLLLSNSLPLKGWASGGCDYMGWRVAVHSMWVKGILFVRVCTEALADTFLNEATNKVKDFYCVMAVDDCCCLFSDDYITSQHLNCGKLQNRACTSLNRVNSGWHDEGTAAAPGTGKWSREKWELFLVRIINSSVCGLVGGWGGELATLLCIFVALWNFYATFTATLAAKAITHPKHIHMSKFWERPS